MKELKIEKPTYEELEKITLDVMSRYNELIYAVVRVWPNETRHETALRYIREAERSDPSQCGSTQSNEHKHSQNSPEGL